MTRLTIVFLLLIGSLMAKANTLKPPLREIPKRAWKHKNLLTSEAVKIFGHDRYVSAFAGQIHQESYWKCNARSKYAVGCAQFTWETARWAGATICKSLGEPSPYNINWAVKCMIRYNKFLYDYLPAATECDKLAFMLSGYNGGIGWTVKDRKKTRKKAVPGAVKFTYNGKKYELPKYNQFIWFGNVELFTPRANWAKIENRYYVRRILLELYHDYWSLGYGGDYECRYYRN